jgi:hypothetical protein
MIKKRSFGNPFRSRSSSDFANQNSILDFYHYYINDEDLKDHSQINSLANQINEYNNKNSNVFLS